MKRKVIILATVALIFLFNCDTYAIITSGSGDSYGYTFEIVQNTGNPDQFNATLTNTATSGSDAYINLLAFNMNAILGTDFTIGTPNPNWTFTEGTTEQQFDYVGAPAPITIPPGGFSLTYNYEFTVGFLDGNSDPFSLWTSTTPSPVTGLDGEDDDDVGQVAVRFLLRGEGGVTDAVASNWEGNGGNGNQMPEPTTLFLLAAGLLGLGLYRRMSGPGLFTSQ